MASPPENIRQARERAGLEPADVARAVGLEKPWYYDVETYEDEATENLRLGTLVAICTNARDDGGGDH